MTPGQAGRPMRALLLSVAAFLVLAPVASAQSMYEMPPEVLEWAITDGAPLELDSADTLAALKEVQETMSGQEIHDCVAEITQDVPDSYRVMGTPTQQMFLEKYGTVFSDMGLPSKQQIGRASCRERV